MLRAVLIDDEPKARNILRMLIDEFCPTLAVVGQAGNVPAGLEIIAQERPDVVFLDVEMPRLDGFKLLEMATEIDFEVVFTTAYSQFATKAFEVGAGGYLVKPIQIPHLQKAVVQVEKLRMASKATPLSKPELPAPPVRFASTPRRLPVPTMAGLLLLEVADIMFLEADGSYTSLWMRNGDKHVVAKKLTEFSALADTVQFFRAHRSFLVNLECVVEYLRHDGGMLRMVNGKEVPLSRNQKDAFFERMGVL